MTTLPLAVPYLRYSTDDQEESDSILRQKRVCEAYIRAKGWTLGLPLIDRGRSAYKGEHLVEGAQLYEFTKQAESGDLPADFVLVAEKIDRLSRRPTLETMAWFHKVTLHGYRIAIAEGDHILHKDADIGTVVVSAINTDQSRQESSKKSERITSAKIRLWGMAERREGKWTNLVGRPPQWLKRTADCDDWIQDKHRVGVIREIYGWSADGLGASVICRRLNARSEKPFGIWHKAETHGWGISAVNALLANPAVEGDFVPEKGMFKGRVLHGFYPRIVDADLVARARDAKSARRKVAGERCRVGTVNFFAGLSTCGECGGATHVTTMMRKGRQYRYMRCEAAREGRGCTNTGYYPYYLFEKAALDVLLDLALDDRFFEATGELKKLRIAKAEAEKRIADSKTAHARLTKQFEKGDDLVGDRMIELKGEIADAVAELASIEKDIMRASGKVGAAEHLGRVNDIRAAAESDDFDVSEQARAKLVVALSAIVNSLEVEEINGEKTWTVALAGGVMGLRFSGGGELTGMVSDAAGRPLYEHLSPERQEALAPLIRRIKSLST